MRKIGLIGGMSWLSTRTYYEQINRLVQARKGFPASAPLLIESLDYASLARLSGAEEWKHAAEVLADSARRLEAAGATALLIGANAHLDQLAPRHDLLIGLEPFFKVGRAVVDAVGREIAWQERVEAIFALQ